MKKSNVKQKKVVKAWAILSGNKPMFVGRCDLFSGGVSINHLEIFPTYKDAKEVANDSELGFNPDIVKVEIHYTLPLTKKSHEE